jgi:hypothetical protein
MGTDLLRRTANADTGVTEDSRLDHFGFVLSVQGGMRKGECRRKDEEKRKEKEKRGGMGRRCTVVLLGGRPGKVRASVQGYAVVRYRN